MWTWLRALVLVVCAVSSAACSRPSDPRVLRLGYFPNLTHAPALTGVASGRFARALGAVRLETRVFNAGPAAVEALLAGALDAAYVGPMPAVAGHLRTHGRALRVVAGAASGGALFVVRRGAGIHGAGDLHGKRIATPQLGGTQDLALRRWLRANGLAPQESGGDVRVVPMENASALALLRQGALDGAWVPEPWAARLVAEADAEVLLDERDLWPGRTFATTVLVARLRYLREARSNVAALVRANAAEVAWITAHPAEAPLAANAAIGSLPGRALAPEVLRVAWSRIDFTTDPQRASLAANARSGQEVGLLPTGSIDDLVMTVEGAP